MSQHALTLPPIPPEQQTPTVRLLLAIIEQQQLTIAKLEARVALLEAEVARLKKLPPRPTIKPSSLEKNHDEDDDDPPSGGSGKGTSTTHAKRAGSKKRRKRSPIHRSVIIPPAHLPPGSRLLGYQDYLLQDLVIEPCNTRYRLARYRCPSRKLMQPLEGNSDGVRGRL